MKKFFLIFFLLPTFLFAQKHDYVWHFGGGDLSNNPIDTNWGRTIIDFSPSLSKPIISYDGYKYMDFSITCANISDVDGNYLFSYNGEYIEDANNDTMPNSVGISIHPGDEILAQGGLILPVPESDSKYILLHESWKYINEWSDLAVDKLYFSKIDMGVNNGLGTVVEKRQLLVEDTLDTGKLTGTHHANGRDWWILAPKARNGDFYRILLTPNSISVDGIQPTGQPLRQGIGQALFSPDGTKYAIYSSVDNVTGDFLTIYDFDRCTGFLSNPLHANYYDDGYGGISISPNSKILYLHGWNELYQLDLTSADILASKQVVAETDDYKDPYVNPNGDTLYFGHAFFLGQLAPDGKIYISATGNNNKLMHIIHNPNVWGVGCNVEQHVRMPTFNRTIPNFPNYRLGPIDGSICDSLGINNMPLARFRYDQDTLNSMSFNFMDLSDYEPTEWHWDFGDGTTSQDASPTHVYTGVGVYPVCLTVSNQYGSSTMCDTLYLGVVGTQDIDLQANVRVWPNPFTDYLILSLDGYYPQNAYIYFYDVMGRLLNKQRIWYGVNELDVSGFMKGMIFYEVRDGDLVIGRGKLIRN